MTVAPYELEACFSELHSYLRPRFCISAAYTVDEGAPVASKGASEMKAVAVELVPAALDLDIITRDVLASTVLWTMILLNLVPLVTI